MENINPPMLLIRIIKETINGAFQYSVNIYVGFTTFFYPPPFNRYSRPFKIQTKFIPRFIAKYSGLILIHHPRTAQIPSRITHIQSFMKSHSLKSIFHRKSYRLLPHNHYFFLHHFSFILNDYILSIFHCSFYGRMKRITSM